MKPDQKYPALYSLAQDLRRHFGGRIYGNRGFLFTVANKSRCPQLEIGIGLKKSLIIIEGLSGYDVAFTTNKKHRWRYPCVFRNQQQRRTFYLREATSPKRLDKFFELLSQDIEQILLSEATWFSYEPHAWFVELPTTSRTRLLSVIQTLERHRFQPSAPPNVGPASSVEDSDAIEGPPSVS